MASNGKEVNQELVYLKLDILDRLERYDLDYSKLRAYEEDLRAIATMPPQQRKAQFNRLVEKIRSGCIKKAKEAKGAYE